MSLTRVLKSLLSGRQEPVSKTVAKTDRQWISNPWHAVAVTPGAAACAAARADSGIRYLSKDAPPLPLSSCNAAQCTCRYRHYEDRRSSPRRAADVWSNGGHWIGQERRVAGRRSTDGAR